MADFTTQILTVNSDLSDQACCKMSTYIVAYPCMHEETV